MRKTKHECDDGTPLAVGVFLGFIIGGFTFAMVSIATTPTHHGNHRGVSVEQWTATRDAWLEDRDAWAAGKPFAYHYGPHGERW